MQLPEKLYAKAVWEYDATHPRPQSMMMIVMHVRSRSHFPCNAVRSERGREQ